MTTKTTEMKMEDLASGTVLWLGRDETSYYELMAQEMRAADLDMTEAEMKELAYIDRDEDEFQGYGQMINLLDNGVAVISMKGVMKNRETLWSRIFGTATYEGLSNALIAAAMHDKSRGALIDWDSPGGDVKGISTPSDTIQALRKQGFPVWSYAGGDMMSAAVWIGTNAEKVYANKDAEVGSIGVVAIHKDLSQMYKQMGVKHTIMRAGEQKALVNPYEPLSDKAMAFIDKSLQKNYGRFIDIVAANRGQTPAYIRANAAEGQEFDAEEAKAVHLVDKVVSFDSTIDSFVKRLDRKKEEPRKSSYFGVLPMADKDKVDLNASAAALIGAGLSPEAAAKALADKGITGDGAENEPGAGSTGEQAPGANTSANAGTGSTDDGKDKKGAKDKVPATPSASAGESSVLAGLLADSQKENRDLSVKVAELERVSKENDAALAAYRDLATQAVKSMRIGLGRPGSVDDLKDASHLTLVGSYKAVHGEVVAAFPTQQASKQADGEGPKIPAADLSKTLTKVTSFTRNR